LVLVLLLVGSWLWSAGRMFGSSFGMLLGLVKEQEDRPAPVLPVVVEMTPKPVAGEEQRVEIVVIDEEEPTRPAVVIAPPPGRADVRSTPRGECIIWCQEERVCPELEKLNPGCRVEWPE
jgi:hypothetical protein